MRITILTQSDPFYLAENINYLLSNLPSHSQVVSTVVFDVSPFGKKESFIQKANRTATIFGLGFFINYGFKFVFSKLNKNKSVKYVLKKNNIPIIELLTGINHPESLAQIKAFEPDVLISIAGNQIFKQPLIDLAPKGCLNLHTALLPRYRGLMPSFWVIKNNEKETGVSVFFVDKGIDSGPILVQRRMPIDEDMSQAELIKKSKKMGMNAIIEAIELIQKDNYEIIPNDDEDKSYYSFPTKADVKAFKKAGKKFY
ncbi:MAG: formyltransferase family protein [Candidatus Delongbacteria bacterium]|jgi:methionyl-tRNA formyltransferase|nr:formyltransferase family protein [Candidatus Delongbacteria bacterium]